MMEDVVEVELASGGNFGVRRVQKRVAGRNQFRGLAVE